MIGGLGLIVTGLAAAAALAAVSAPPATGDVEARGEALGAMIQSRLRADGPFFTPEERVVIERACGYRPGEWDGFEVSIDDHVLRCTDGRRVDTPEVRAVMAAAEPRIEARVEAIMESAEVRETIDRIAEDAAAIATREVDLAMARLEDLEIDVDVDIDHDPDPDE